MYEELGGAKLLPSFVEAGSVDGKKFALPVLLRLALHVRAQGHLVVGGRRDAEDARRVQRGRRPRSRRRTRRDIKNFSGFFIGGQDWRNGISWIFANGGDLAKKQDGQWVSTLSDPNSLKGLAQLQAIYEDRVEGSGRRQGPVAVALHQRHRRDHRRQGRGDRQDLARRRHDHGSRLGALVHR